MSFQDKPTTPPEKSLQFMAWNHKGIDEKMATLISHTDRIARALEMLTKALAKKSGDAKSLDDDIPF